MKKRYISIFLFILLVSAFFVYHLYPRDVKVPDAKQIPGWDIRILPSMQLPGIRTFCTEPLARFLDLYRRSG